MAHLSDDEAVAKMGHPGNCNSGRAWVAALWRSGFLRFV